MGKAPTYPLARWLLSRRDAAQRKLRTQRSALEPRPHRIFRRARLVRRWACRRRRPAHLLHLLEDFPLQPQLKTNKLEPWNWIV
jgi:hypothetical protein